jgi:ureidoglycolate lyase
MRFVTFVSKSNGSIGKSESTPRAGVLLTDSHQVLDLGHEACLDLLGSTQPCLLTMIEQGLQVWQSRIHAYRFSEQALVPLQSVQLLAPLQRPGKVMGAAFNFRDALAERGMAPPAEPVVFFRSGQTVIGPDEAILIPPDVGDVAYEGELAAIIGRRALCVSEAEAMTYVAGYTIHNDVSGSGLLKRDSGNFLRGKNLPATAPLGPWIATPDEVVDPHQIRIKLEVDGRVLQDGSTENMVYRIPQLISWISHRFPLEPGDVIATGTPGGGASTHTPPAWLLPGQKVTVSLEGLGQLVNPVKRGVPFFEAP